MPRGRIDEVSLCRVPDGLADRRDAAQRHLRDLAYEAQSRTGLPLMEAWETYRRADAAFLRAIERAAAVRS